MRKLATAAAVSLSLVSVPGSIQAVSLGDIEMYSTLNQPLDAEVGILAVTRDDLRDLVVKGAPVGGVETDASLPPDALSNLRFKIVQRPDGSPAIRITSDAPVIEPFLNFMLSVDTAGGDRMVREYTVLLDPPVFGLAQTDFADDLLPSGNSVETDGSAVIQRQPKVSIPNQGVVVDFSGELEPQTVGQLPANLSDEDRVEVTLSDVTGKPAQPVATRNNDSIQTSNSITPEPSQRYDVSLEGLAASSEGEEIELLPEMFETEKPYAEIDLGELAIARDDRWYETATEVDLVEPIARDDSWYASAVDVELTPAMFGLDVPPASESVETVADAGSATGSTDFQTDIDLTAVIQPADRADDSRIALEEEFDYSKDGVPVPLDELAASISRRVIGNTDSEVMMYEESRVPLARTEIPAVATAESILDQTSVAQSDIDLQNELFDTSDSDADGGEPVGERIDIEKELPAFEARKKEQEALASGPKTYRVQGSDTLWSIAEQSRADGVSTQQMMVALLRANRNAFVDQDMNRLRNGAILRIPEQSTVASVGQAEALALVRDQMSLWQQYRGNTPVASVSAPLQTEAEPVQEEAEAETQAQASVETEDAQPEQPQVEPIVEADPQDRLTIVGVDGSAQDAENAGLADGGSEESSADSVAAQLAEERAIAERLEAEEQQARERELAAIEAGKQRLITLQEEQMAALQEQTSSEAADAADSAEQDAATQSGQTEVVEPEAAVDSDAAGEDLGDPAEQSEEQSISPAVAQQLEAMAAESDAKINALVAEAQSRSERLAGEADAIEAQLVSLQSEKQAWEEIGDQDKAALVAEAEQEKARLLAGAQSEQERIAAELDVQRQAVIDDLERRQRELKANPDAQLIADAPQQAVSDSIEPTLAAGDSEEQTDDPVASDAPIETPVVVADSSDEVDTDAAGATPLDADEATEAGDLQTAIVDARAQSPVSEQPSDTQPAGIGATLQRAIGDRNTLLGAGAGLALLGLLGAWLLRRKPKAAAKSGARVEPDFTPREPQVADNDKQARTSADTATATAGAATAAVVTKSRTAGPEAMDETLAQDDTVSEADVYLAYGLYGQAEELLTAAIDRSPDDPDLQMKLIETHFVQRDREKFQAAAARFQDRFDDSQARDRIDQMSSELEGPVVEADSPQDDSPTGVIDALATGGDAAEVDIPPIVQQALDAESDAANQATLPDNVSSNDADDLHGLDELFGDRSEPDDSQLAEIAADEVELPESVLDQTIDPGAEFAVSELEATGDFGSIEMDNAAVANNEGSIDIADATLDEVDLSAFDDDGTLNLDGVAGDTMSELDIENMDLTQQGLDSTLDNLTLDDAELNLDTGALDDTQAAVADAGEGSDMGTMLDLAKAYLDMGDNDSALSALREIAQGGTAEQREEANALLKSLG